MASNWPTIASGVFTSDGTTKNIGLRSDFDTFEVYNYTQAATQQGTGRGVQFVWQSGMADGTGIEIKKTNSTDALNMVTLTSGGFTRNDTSVQTVGAAKTVVSITQANPAVVTVTAHGYSNGDTVRLYGSTGMLQASGIDYTIASVTTDTFTLAYLNSSGFAAAATGGTVRKVPNPDQFYPRNNRILGITAAAAAVITLSVTHGLTVGQKVRVHCGTEYGMSQINDLIGTITAINTTTNTITTDIDSSAFTAFAFPTSANAAAVALPPIIVPIADANSTLDGATDNVSAIVMSLAAGAQSPAGSSGDVIYWKALASQTGATS